MLFVAKKKTLLPRDGWADINMRRIVATPRASASQMRCLIILA